MVAVTGMKNEERQAVLEQILSRQLDWIAAAEARINLLLTVETAMVAALFTAHLSNPDYVGIARCLSWLAQGLLTAGLVFLGLACFPRTNGPSNSMIFFGSIAKRSLKEYSDTMAQVSSADYFSDLAAQAHRNAEIATVKFRWVRFSIVALLASVPIWVWAFATLVATRIRE